jgi:1-deoxy-D-xylulose-5-phosphate reductoisomerase
VVRHLPDEFEIAALAAKSNIDLLCRQAQEFRPKVIAVYDPDAALALQKRLPEIPVLAGMEGLEIAASFEGADFTLLAMTGSAGLLPAAAAIRSKKGIGLANKEVLVSGGEWITNLAREHGVDIIPVDSEHCALHQCLKGENPKAVRRLILTASGGAFRNKTAQELETVGLEEALTHPNWNMGPKVTIDCTTLANKGLEMIEARWLFNIEPSRIEAVVHPQSIVHSLVEFVDGSILASMAEPDMVLPIQYALSYPRRLPGLLPPYDFLKHPTLTFQPPDNQRFPCLRLATYALSQGRSYPCFFNAANEVLVERFIQREIPWISIGRKMEKLISSHASQDVLTLDAILSVDKEAREMARQA